VAYLILATYKLVKFIQDRGLEASAAQITLFFVIVGGLGNLGPNMTKFRTNLNDGRSFLRLWSLSLYYRKHPFNRRKPPLLNLCDGDHVLLVRIFFFMV
jgi:hypothetical protein